jgi:hypothetical protein
MNEKDPLMSGQAWRDWCDKLKDVGESILAPEYPQDPRGRAEGYRFLTRLMVHAVNMELETADTAFPRFVRYETPTNQWGGPNPDNIYLRANIDAAATYRVWGSVADVRQLIVSLNEGDMQLGEFGVFSEQSLDQFEIGDDALLEFWISPDEQPKNWIRSDPKARLLTVRIYQSDWEQDAAHPLHIERVGGEGIPRPALTPDDVARGLERSAKWVEASASFWNTYTSAGWDRATPNVAAEARPAPGGADNILYGACFWDLADAEALLIECDKPDADYWNFTIHTLGWLESGDFAERQTSLSGHQAHVDGDGRVRIVLGHSDPGTPNWIDTEGRGRGLLVYRWVWARNNPIPSSRVLAPDEIRGALPADHPVIDTDSRHRSLARRREAAWKRFL